MKSRVKGDFHARFRENAMVKVHGVTQLGSIPHIQKLNRLRMLTTRKLALNFIYLQCSLKGRF